MPEIVVPDRFNAAGYFVDRHWEEGRGKRTAILYREQAISYREVAEQVNRVGNALRESGVAMEQRVMLLLLDCPELVYSFFGAIKIGAVPVPVNTLLTGKDYRFLLEDSRARVLIVSADLLPVVAPVLPELKVAPTVIVVGKATGFRSFDDWIEGCATYLEPAATSKDDVAFWLYTSGTTGQARATVHLQHDMVFCSALYAEGVLGITAEDRTYSVAKLFFAYGLGNALYFPFGVGATTILIPERPTPAVVFATVNRYRPTLFFGVPTAYAAMLQSAEQGAQVDMASVRAAVSAGEPLPASLYRRWKERFGVEILDGIGSTEILHIFISNRPGAVRPGSTGTVVPGYEAKLVDENGLQVPTGEIGNLLVRGDSICSQYWNRHDATRRAIEGEWIRTGDKYHLDEDGFYWYEGRTDDMIKSGGRWVSPAEVESAIVEHPNVLECAVVGQADEEGLMKPKAFVVLSHGHANQQMTEEIQRFVKGRIATYKYPRWVVFVDELPKTATGKIQRYKLRTVG